MRPNSREESHGILRDGKKGLIGTLGPWGCLWTPMGALGIPRDSKKGLIRALGINPGDSKKGKLGALRSPTYQ